MEINKIKRGGYEVNVIFTGEQYIFHNSFYGILAVATRKGYKKEEKDIFILEYGNDLTVGYSLGGSVCEIIAKDFIRKCESKYVKCDTQFEVIKVDVNAKYYILVQAKER